MKNRKNLPNKEYCFSSLILYKGNMMKSLKKSSNSRILGSILKIIESKLNSFSKIVETFGISSYFYSLVLCIFSEF